MSTRTETPTARPAVDGVGGARILIVESRYYVEIADALGPDLVAVGAQMDLHDGD